MSLLWLTFWLLQQVNIFHSLISSSHHALKLFLCLSSHFSLALSATLYFAWSSNREFRTQDLFNLLIQKKQISSADKIPDHKPLVGNYIGNYLTEPSYTAGRQQERSFSLLLWTGSKSPLVWTNRVIQSNPHLRGCPRDGQEPSSPVGGFLAEGLLEQRTGRLRPQ